MIPSPFVALILALAAFRCTRLVGWDDLGPIVKVRDWATGAHIERSSVAEVVAGAPEKYWAYRRPLLRHFLGCAFCAGFWICLIVYAVWVAAGSPGALASESWVFYGLVPLALSSVVGLTAKRLDP